MRRAVAGSSQVDDAFEHYVIRLPDEDDSEPVAEARHKGMSVAALATPDGAPHRHLANAIPLILTAARRSGQHLGR